jgi:hypothetical protein
MAITYQSISTLASKTTTTLGSLTLNEPPGTTDGDLLVACIAYRGDVLPNTSEWIIAEGTSAIGNTATNQTAVGSGIIAYTIKDPFTSYSFGNPVVGEFPDVALGYVLRLTGQDFTNPLLGRTENTLASGSSGLVTADPYITDYQPRDNQDRTHILLCIGGQEVTWSGQKILPFFSPPGFPIDMTEVGESTSTAGADVSISVAYYDGSSLDGGAEATTSAINARHSLVYAVFGGPRPFPYSFATFF